MVSNNLQRELLAYIVDLITVSGFAWECPFQNDLGWYIHSLNRESGAGSENGLDLSSDDSSANIPSVCINRWLTKGERLMLHFCILSAIFYGRQLSLTERVSRYPFKPFSATAFEDCNILNWSITRWCMGQVSRYQLVTVWVHDVLVFFLQSTNMQSNVILTDTWNSYAVS